MPARPKPSAKPAAPSSAEPALPGVSLITAPYPTGLPNDAAGRLPLLDALRQEVAGCTRCPQLVACRTQTVFGVGNPTPRVAFFGEAPGENEDKQGEPFVGRAGKLLNDIIKACSWQREDVFILNTIKCRPPSNRNPLPEEVTNCRGYYERQLEILRPEFIVCLGSVAAQALLETEITVGKLRGKVHRYRDSKVVVTYHPAYLLRNPDAKKFTWEDMQLLMREMGQKIPGKA